MFLNVSLLAQWNPHMSWVEQESLLFGLGQTSGTGAFLSLYSLIGP